MLLFVLGILKFTALMILIVNPEGNIHVVYFYVKIH